MAKSKAILSFTSSLLAAEELVEIEKTLPNPPRKAGIAKTTGLRGGAAVLMVASFESFLKSAIVEHLTELTVNPPPVAFGTLPEKMQINSVFNCLDAAMKGKPHSQTLKRDRLPDIRLACSRVAAEIIDPHALSQTQSNPSPETVTELFKGLGLPDVFARVHARFIRKWGKPEAATFIPDKLAEIVQRRHRVAHTGTALDITRTQLNESLKFLRILAPLLDAQIRSHVDSLYPP